MRRRNGLAIFRKTRLRPSQLRTVSDRRFDDAFTLCQTGRNARANGAMYLGGFVIECLLKAGLLERFVWLQSARSPEGRNSEDQRLWSLCYRSHDLDEILERMPHVQERLLQHEQGESRRLTQSLKSVCAHWTVHARYSPYNADIEDARTFLDQVEELRKCLRQV
jgi:hypothetical protein